MTKTVYVLTYADIGVCEDSKAHENFEDKLTAPAVFATWKAAAKHAELEFFEIWSETAEAEEIAEEGRPSPHVEWDETDDQWDFHYEELGMGWRITAVPLHD